jgi:F0F1-type ATP synthase membrane subunit b/b'
MLYFHRASLQTISALKQESDNLHTQMQEQLLIDIRSLRSEIAADPSTRALEIAEYVISEPATSSNRLLTSPNGDRTLADEFDRMKRLIRANSTEESEGKTPPT